MGGHAMDAAMPSEGLTMRPVAANASASVARRTLNEPLQRYLRTLWSVVPALGDADHAPFIVGQTIHLPARRPAADRAGAWRWYRAAAAHAAAHLAYSPPVFDGRGLAPIARALLGLLEDARVEALACRELPGLRRLWVPLHTATLLDGDGFEALLLRLARSLIDSGYDDPHPWVQKGSRLFFIEAETQVLALRRPDELRRAATLLGNDIGQMRLQFNARLHVPGPDYRDDLRWMWPAPAATEPEPACGEVPGGAGSHDSSSAEDARPSTSLQRYPEWDRLIARLRPDWCAVFDEHVESVFDAAEPVGIDLPAHPVRAALRNALKDARPRTAARPQPAEDGDRLDPNALVRARIAHRLRLPVEVRVHLRAGRARTRGRVMLLVDQSASSAEAWGESGRSLLQAACEVAALAADSWQSVSVAPAIAGFCSSGRLQVQLQTVKDFADPLDAAALRRLAALRSRHSTRLGAVIRHATRCLLAGRHDGSCQLVLISDGQPHDIDVHDPQYLVDDARRAVQQALRQGVQVTCIVLDPSGLAVARRIFGARRIAGLTAIEYLPRVARALAF